MQADLGLWYRVGDNDSFFTLCLTYRHITDVFVICYSARKPEKPTNYLQQIKGPAQDDNQKPMYCKDKIYGGAEEYSFEELRAVRWLKKQEQKRREEEEAKALAGNVRGMQ